MRSTAAEKAAFMKYGGVFHIFQKFIITTLPEALFQ